MSYESFVADLEKFGLTVQQACDGVLREACTTLTRQIVNETPVLTGTARSNYFWGSSRVTDTDLSNVSQSGAPSIERATTFLNSIHAGEIIYLTNNLDYIGELEFGATDRPPNAMMRTAAANWKQIGKDAESKVLR